jgi:GTP cyclohydrolase IA
MDSTERNAALVAAMLFNLEVQDHYKGLREGLKETPMRAAKAWDFYTSGYNRSPTAVLKIFEDGSESYDEMVVVNGIEFYSTCEHHMAPIIGSATVGYIPNKKIVGLSKMHRLVDIFARRLQVQERMTVEIADALWTSLAPLGVGVMLHARHLCVEMRGVQQRGGVTTTSALHGVFKTDAIVRAEFMALAKVVPVL